MKINYVYVIYLVLLSTNIAFADTNVTLLLGSRSLDQSEDVLPAAGLYAQKKIDNFPLNPEISLLFASDPLNGGSEYDVGAGGIYNLYFQKYKFYLGAGVSLFSSSYGDNDSDGMAFYGHGGISWTVNTSLSVGLDIRKSFEIDSKSNSGNDDIGYSQYAISFERLWK